MNNELVSAILLGLIPLTAGTVIFYWNHATGGRLRPRKGHWCPVGTWREWPAGRSLMGLLGIITVGFAYGVLNRFLGQYPAKFAVAVALYALFIGAIIFIGFTIRKELRVGAAKAAHPANPPVTGSIDITVASDPDPDHTEKAQP